VINTREQRKVRFYSAEFIPWIALINMVKLQPNVTLNEASP